MTTYISILRGINVSGQKIIKMDALRKLYEDLGFHKVTTYLQSGNVVFTDKGIDPKELVFKITQQIANFFDFDVPVTILTLDELKQVIDNNPYIKDPGKNQNFLYVMFLFSKPYPYDTKSIEDKKQNGEEIFFYNSTVYLYCPNGYGRTKLTNNFLEAKLKIGATTRNWKTTNELLKIAQQI